MTAMVLTPSYARQNIAEEARQARTEADLRKYHALLNAYRDGDDDSVTQIVGWDWKRLEEAIGALGSTLDIRQAEVIARVKIAAMLHTDAALRFPDTESLARAFHLGLAGRLLLRGEPWLHAFSREWYATVARVLRERLLLFEAEPFLQRGRERVPGDGTLLFESALLQEHIATFAAFDREAPSPDRSPLDSRKFSSPAPDFDRDRNHRLAERRNSLNRAAEWLDAALKLDPSSIDASLHLGRVQMLRGNEKEALRLLQGVNGASDASAAYLAALFIGAIHERSKRLDVAEEMYRKAIKGLPSGHSGHVALSQVLQRLGRGDESRAVLTRLVSMPRDAATDPWWWYLADRPGELRARLNALRASVRK